METRNAKFFAGINGVGTERAPYSARVTPDMSPREFILQLLLNHTNKNSSIYVDLNCSLLLIDTIASTAQHIKYTGTAMQIGPALVEQALFALRDYREKTN